MYGLQCQVPLDPLLPVGLHRGPVREGQFSLDVLDDPEGADVEHGVGVVLVLHPAVQQLVVAALLPDQTLVQTGWVENILRLQPQFLSDRKGKVLHLVIQGSVIQGVSYPGRQLLVYLRKSYLWR